MSLIKGNDLIEKLRQKREEHRKDNFRSVNTSHYAGVSAMRYHHDGILSQMKDNYPEVSAEYLANLLTLAPYGFNPEKDELLGETLMKMVEERLTKEEVELAETAIENNFDSVTKDGVSVIVCAGNVEIRSGGESKDVSVDTMEQFIREKDRVSEDPNNEEHFGTSPITTPLDGGSYTTYTTTEGEPVWFSGEIDASEEVDASLSMSDEKIEELQNSLTIS